MGASRETLNIWLDIRSRKWEEVKKKLKILFFITKNEWRRGYIIKDSFETPFNKKIGCKLFGHRWSTPDEEKKYDFDTGRHHCWKCCKWITDSEMRDEKIERILK